MQKFFEELKRRNVFRMAIAYGVTCWLMLQVADLGLQAIAAPDWVMRAFMLAFVIGLPFVLIFSWVFELTPEGIKREREIDRTASVTHDTGRKLNYVTIGMLALAIAVVFFRGALAPGLSDTSADRSADKPDDASIAVLAFENMSSDEDQGYFADGLSEELLNKLAQIPELKVAGRTSSFAFKGQNRDLREIGEILNVAYILEGSVRRAGEQIRVTAQLIDAAEGFHLFSETYDGDMRDVFSVQDSIAERISAALVLELTGDASNPNTSGTTPEVYELYLRAREDIISRDFDRLNRASTMLARALELDPAYAPALVQKALVTFLLSDASGAYGNTPVAVAQPIAEQLVGRALLLDDSLAEAHAVNGLLLDQAGRRSQAIEALERALRINPSSSAAGTWLATAVAGSGDSSRGRELLEQVVVRDPLFGPAFNNLLNEQYLRGAQLDRALALVNRVSAITGETKVIRYSRASINLMAGKLADAARLFESTIDQNAPQSTDRLWYGFVLFGLGDFETLRQEGVTRHQPMALAGLGDAAGIRAYVEEVMPPVRGARSRFFRNACWALNSIGDMQGCIDVVMSDYDSVGQLIADEPIDAGWETEYAAPLAYAFLQNGDVDNFQILVDEMRRALPLLSERGSASWVLDRSRAELAALTGDRDALIEHLQNAVASGGLRGPLFWRSKLLDPFQDDPQFISVRDQAAAARDAERGKLGLPPYISI